MVAAPPPGSSDEQYYAELTESWPERPSRKRTKRVTRRRQDRRVVVHVDRLDSPDTGRMSKGLLTAQRELSEAQAERDARVQEEQQ